MKKDASYPNDRLEKIIKILFKGNKKGYIRYVLKKFIEKHQN
jgi:hypothetical protein